MFGKTVASKYRFTFQIESVINLPPKYDEIRVSASRSGKKGITETAKANGRVAKFDATNGKFEISCSLTQTSKGKMKDKIVKIAIHRMKKNTLRPERTIGTTMLNLAQFATVEGYNGQFRLDILIPEHKITSSVALTLTSVWVKNGVAGDASSGSELSTNASLYTSDEEMETTDRPGKSPVRREAAPMARPTVAARVEEEDQQTNSARASINNFGVIESSPPHAIQMGSPDEYGLGTLTSSTTASMNGLTPAPSASAAAARLSRSQMQLAQGLESVLPRSSLRGSTNASGPITTIFDSPPPPVPPLVSNPSSSQPEPVRIESSFSRVGGNVSANRGTVAGFQGPNSNDPTAMFGDAARGAASAGPGRATMRSSGRGAMTGPTPPPQILSAPSGLNRMSVQLPNNPTQVPRGVIATSGTLPPPPVGANRGSVRGDSGAQSMEYGWSAAPPPPPIGAMRSSVSGFPTNTIDTQLSGMYGASAPAPVAKVDTFNDAAFSRVQAAMLKATESGTAPVIHPATKTGPATAIFNDVESSDSSDNGETQNIVGIGQKKIPDVGSGSDGNEGGPTLSSLMSSSSAYNSSNTIPSSSMFPPASQSHSLVSEPKSFSFSASTDRGRPRRRAREGWVPPTKRADYSDDDDDDDGEVFGKEPQLTGTEKAFSFVKAWTIGCGACRTQIPKCIDERQEPLPRSSNPKTFDM